MSKFLFTISFLLLCTSNQLFSTEQGYIEWKAIKGAFGYKLEIRDENKKLIIEEVVNNTRYLIRTPTGKYEFRISPMNVFEKTTVWSYWNPLNVVISKRPSILLTELSLDISELNKPIIFKGKNFLTDTKLKFIWGNRTLNPKTITLSDPGTLTVIISPENAVQGKYELVMENPGNRILSIKNFLNLSDNNEADRLAREKAERERLEAERLAREKAERDRLEAERLAKMSEKDRLEAERLARERERLEAERLAREKAERDRLEAERLARSKSERERLEAERLERERLAREKAERDRLEAERLAREKAEWERLERERLARERMKDKKQIIIDGIEDSSNREYLNVGSYDLDMILNDFKKSCSPSNLLETLVEKCFSNHSVLKMGTIQKADILNYLLLNSDNYRTRIKSYTYFMKEGSPQMKAALEKMLSKVDKTSSIDLEEKEFIEKAIDFQKKNSK
jgi:hypothetical protein